MLCLGISKSEEDTGVELSKAREQEPLRAQPSYSPEGFILVTLFQKF